MTLKISAADLTGIKLNALDTVTSVMQNIAALLSTRKGTVPLYREFGLSQEWLDKKMPMAKMMIAELREEIERWEPRARFVGVTFAGDELQPGTMIPTVEVEINAE